MGGMTEKPTWQPTFVAGLSQAELMEGAPRMAGALAEALEWHVADDWPTVEVGTPVLIPDGTQVGRVVKVFDDGGVDIKAAELAD